MTTDAGPQDSFVRGGVRADLVWVGARAVTFALEDGGAYETRGSYALFLNGKPAGETGRAVTTLYGLAPDTAYALCARAADGAAAEISFHTARESVTLDVRAFGAAGDGLHDDTPALQAAILCCPERGRVLVPAGRYRTGPLFLKSGLRLELAAGATLQLHTDRRHFPILPAPIATQDGEDEFHLGTWEGVPRPAFAALLTGVNVRDVEIYGQGVLDGQADQSDWWDTPRECKGGAYRGRMVFLCRCEKVLLQGVTVQNSPSWNLHPYLSREIAFVDMHVRAPRSSPNTDGLDPESCRGVKVLGVRFSVGDDCIAIKAGKKPMGTRPTERPFAYGDPFGTPCEDLEIRHCLMENGHGGVSIGSETSGGVQRVTISDCLMRDTDRGLRIKTRRGRGSRSVVGDISLKNVRMERVGAPVTVNCFYNCCDDDAHSQAVQSRAWREPDDDTPTVSAFTFENVEALECGACAAYFLGLPERKIGSVTLRNARFTLNPDAQPMEPVMTDGIQASRGLGITAINVETLCLENVLVEGCAGDALVTAGVDAVEGGINA